ncbi:MAG: flippase-like domain-containing protein, partial [Proteobacteria bacterium]|nr:flippase-like domain-containing protein [Pseudomonadota bacterium]
LAILFIFSSAPVVLLLFVPDHVFTPGESTLVPLGVFLALYTAFFLVLLFRTRWLIAPIQTVLRAMLRWHLVGHGRYRRWRFSAKRETLRFAEGFRKYARGDIRYVALSVFFTVVFLLSLFSFPAFLLHGLGYDVAYLESVGLTALTTFVMYFSPTPGASGIAEGVFGALFVGVIDMRHLVLVTLAWRFLTIHIGMMIGIVAIHYEITTGGNERCVDANA